MSDIVVRPHKHDGSWRAKCTVPDCLYVMYSESRDQAADDAAYHERITHHYARVQAKVDGRW